MSSPADLRTALLYMKGQDQLLIVSARLVAHGFHVVAAGSLDECRRALEQHELACAFVELDAQHAQDVLVIDELRNHLADAPIVVLCALDEPGAWAAGRHAGADHHLPTPVNSEKLESLVAELHSQLDAARTFLSGPLLSDQSPDLEGSPWSSPHASSSLAHASSSLAHASSSQRSARSSEPVPLPDPLPDPHPEQSSGRADDASSESPALPLPDPEEHPSAEIDRLRIEVSQLRVDCAQAQQRALAAEQRANETVMRMHEHEARANHAISQAREAARGPSREAPSIAGGHPPEVDELTGLIGAGALQDHLDREYARARRYGHALSVLMLDLDRLARYQKSHGAEAADRALCLVADVLRSALRSPDIAARLGDDHFVVLATDTTEEQGYLLAERLRAALKSEGQHASQPPVTVSIGIAGSGRLDVRRAEDLLVAAQHAVTQAKAAGRDRSVIAAA